VSDERLSNQERIARYLEGGMDPAERRRFEQDVLDDDQLSKDLYAEINLDESLRESGLKVVRSDGGRAARRTQWLVRFALPIAAVLAIAVLTPLLRREPDSVMRGEGEAPRLISPVGTYLSENLPRRFEWSKDRGAARYRFELYDAESRRLYETVTGDTSLVVPDSLWPSIMMGLPDSSRVGFSRGDSFSWRVVPIDGSGFERSPSSTATVGIRLNIPYIR
jgi:hypothetical protein